MDFEIYITNMILF